MDEMQDFADTMRSIKDSLEMKQEEMILGIDYKDNISLGGELTRKSVFVVKIQDEDGKIKYLVSDKDLNKIASIANNGRIELSPRERQLWEQFIGKEGEQTAEQKKYYDFDKEYFSEEYREEEKEDEIEKTKKDKEEEKEEKDKEENDEEKEKEKELEENKPQIDNEELDREDNPEEQKKKEVAKTLNLKSSQVRAIIKIDDRENFGKAIDKKLYADTYIVKYGKNKVKLMQTDGKGSFKEMPGLQYSEFSLEVMEQLHINKPSRSNATIRKGDITTIRGESMKDYYVIVREKDPDKGIAIKNTENNTEVYTFDDRNIDSIRELKTTEQYKISYDDKIKAEMEAEIAEKEAIEAIKEAHIAEEKARNAEGNEKDKAEEDAELARNNAKEKIEEAESKGKDIDEDDEGRTPWGDAYDRMSRH